MCDCDVVSELVPPDCVVQVDDFNGCFRIKYKGIRRKSVSWTLRGRVEAIKLAVNLAWKIHVDFGGDPCPWQAVIDDIK